MFLFAHVVFQRKGSWCVGVFVPRLQPPEYDFCQIMHFPTTPPGLLTSLRFLQLELSLLLLSLFCVVLIIVAVAVLVALVLIVVLVKVVVLVSHRVLSRVMGVFLAVVSFW